MTVLFGTYLHLAVDVVSAEPGAIEAFLVERCRHHSIDRFRQSLEIEARTEEGSLKVWLQAAGIIYAVVAGYGSFRSGIDYIIKDGRTVSELVLGDFLSTGLEESKVLRFERRTGVPGKIDRLLKDVDSLQRSGRALPDTDQQVALYELSRRVIEIESALDNNEDREYFTQNVVAEFPDIGPQLLNTRGNSDRQLPIPDPFSLPKAILSDRRVYKMREPDTSMLANAMEPPKKVPMKPDLLQFPGFVLAQ